MGGGYGSDVTVSVSGGTLTFGSGYNDYPSSIGLPNGSAFLKFNDGGEGQNDDLHHDGSARIHLRYSSHISFRGSYC